MYTIFWLIMFLLKGDTTLTFLSLPFWALIVAILADIFYFGFWPARARWFGPRP